MLKERMGYLQLLSPVVDKKKMREEKKRNYILTATTTTSKCQSAVVNKANIYGLRSRKLSIILTSLSSYD